MNLREARTSAAIRHENVVAIHAVEDDPIPYLVMEYIPGQTLQHRLDQQGPLSVTEVLMIGRQIAEGLAAAHAQGLIHRDIKPGNILMEGGVTERVKITDFGLARAADDASMTQSGVIAGTPLYMAPEQARGDTLDHRADLFSLGSVLYQVVSGRPPFRAANTVAVLKRVCDDAPRAIQEIIPETPAWLSAIIFRLLEKNRDDRFQTAQEVAAILGRCQTEWEAKGSVSFGSGDSATELYVHKHAKGSDRAGTSTDRQRGVLLGIGMTLIAVVFVLVVSPRMARWFDTPIPALPQTEVAGGLLFDGRDDHVEVSGLDWNYPQFTIEVFVTSAANSENGTLVWLGSSGLEDDEWMSLFDGPQADPGKRISGAAIKGKTRHENAYGPFVGKQRQHRALVFDGRHLHYFINGVWQGERRAEAHEGLEWKMKELRIGCDGKHRQFFQGGLDQLRISRVARYSENFSPKARLTSDDRTLALYNFDENSGSTLYDSSGNQHHGTIHRATWEKAKEPSSTPSRSSVPPSNLSTSNPQFPILNPASWHGWPADAPKPAIAPFDAEQAKAHQAAWAKYLGVPVEYENSIGMKLRLIPPGEFLMGSTPEELDRLQKQSAEPLHTAGETPRHRVVLSQPFFMGAHEITVGQFRSFVDKTKYETDAERVGYLVNGELKQEFNWRQSNNSGQGDHHPVVFVTRKDTDEFYKWLSHNEGRAYRLPTEAQWEFACRAGTNTLWYFGDDPDLLDQHAWFRDNSTNTTHPVGGKLTNPFGLFDLYGNAEEQCLDWHDIKYYAVSPGRDPQGPSEGTKRVLRGGLMFGIPAHMRSGRRWQANSTGRGNGFRVIVEHATAASEAE